MCLNFFKKRESIQPFLVMTLQKRKLKENVEKVYKKRGGRLNINLKTTCIV